MKAQQFYNDLGLYQLCSALQKIVEFKDFSRLLSSFPVLFKADLMFQFSVSLLFLYVKQVKTVNWNM